MRTVGCCCNAAWKKNENKATQRNSELTIQEWTNSIAPPMMSVGCCSNTAWQTKSNEQNGENQELASPIEIDEAREPRERSKLIATDIQPWETLLKRGGKEEKKKLTLSWQHIAPPTIHPQDHSTGRLTSP